MSVSSLLPLLLIHPGRVTRDALGVCSAADLADAAEREQVVPQALAGLEHHARHAHPDDTAHVDAMRAAARRWTLYEALQRQVIVEVMDAAAGTRMLFFKGAALAYGVYPAPASRMRLDWDILVAPEDARAIERVLERLEFVKDLKAPAGIRVRQHSYRRDLGEGECTIDLHTGLFNAPAIAARARFDDLFDASVPLPSLHPAARGTADADALVIACLHRLVHHAGDPRLIWDYDVHLLTHRLEDSFARVMQRAAAWRVAPILAREIWRVAGRLDTAVPPRVIGALQDVPEEDEGFARDNRSRGDDFLIDWRALGWRDRAALVRETFLPDPAFVRASSGSRLPLPLLYVRRLVLGAVAWLTRPRRP